jgi:hypothetical protein
MSMGIRLQLTLLVPGVVALTLSAVAAIALRDYQRDEFEVFIEQRENVLRALSVTVATSVAQNDMGGLDTVVAEASERLKAGELTELAVLEDDGRVLAHTVPERFNEVFNDPFSRLAIDSQGAAWAREGDVLRMSVPASSGIRWATLTSSATWQPPDAGGSSAPWASSW